MNKYILYLLFLCTYICAHANHTHIEKLSTEQLVNLLDETLDKRNDYISQKEQRIDMLKNMLKQTSDLEEQSKVSSRLGAEYRHFNCDSAMKYINENWGIALRLGNKNEQTRVMLTKIQMLISIGMYSEAWEMFKLFQNKNLPNELKKQYFHCGEETYNCLKSYATYSMYWDEFGQKSKMYLDSLLLITPPNTPQYNRTLARKLKVEGDSIAAKKIYMSLLDDYEIGTRDYSMICASLSEVETDKDNRKRYLLLSAISDVMSAIKEYKSLRELALLSYSEGDINRANLYCSICMDDANFYNARHRSLETAQIQPIINKAYRKKIEEQNRSLRICLIVISVTFLLLLVLFITLYRQNKKLTIARKSLQIVNDDLNKVNNELHSLNDSLHETNLIKNEYLNRFMILSSSYISNLKQYQNKIYSKIISGKIKDLKIILQSTDLVDNSVKEFYKNFDEAFLTIYPNYMIEFNNLLKEEERFDLSAKDSLPSEVRVFALMRLGITDTESIAKFLQYSTNTIYTYTTKMRAKAINKDEFNKMILTIG